MREKARMGKVINLNGQRFGRLVVVGELGRKRGQVLWLCKCDCERTVQVMSYRLRSGHTQSCGCLQRERVAANRYLHGHKRRDKKSPTYSSWRAMSDRCTNLNHDAYARYGGAGVIVAPEWTTFEGFLASMGERPEGTTLGRILDMGNYEPGNCAWQTKPEQTLNRENRKALLKWAVTHAAL